MNRHTMKVVGRLVGAWQKMIAGARAMYPASDVRPVSPYDTFLPDGSVGGNEIGVKIRPIVLRLPERGSDAAPKLYIGIKGWLRFEGPFGANDCLRMSSFGTAVGYFRDRGEKLDHIYGVHYDCDGERFGHPIFHAQLGPQDEFSDDIGTYYGQQWELSNKVGHLLRNVRTPCAEMDVFSVFLQICADHLIDETSGNETKRAFRSVKKSCGFFRGVAHGMENFQDAQQCCYRSVRWYVA